MVTQTYAVNAIVGGGSRNDCYVGNSKPVCLYVANVDANIISLRFCTYLNQEELTISEVGSVAGSNSRHLMRLCEA